MKYAKLSNQELKDKLLKIETFEKRADRVAIECIAEIETRKIYLQEAYPSLFQYLLEVFHYSPAKAQRRIDSARLLREVPDIAEKIESGALTIYQASQVQKAARTIKKLENRRLTVEEKKELLKKVESVSKKETEFVIARELNFPIEPIEREQLHRNASVTLTLTFSSQQMEILTAVRNGLSHCVPSHKWTDVVCFLAHKEYRKRFGTLPRGESAANSVVNSLSVNRASCQSVGDP